MGMGSDVVAKSRIIFPELDKYVEQLHTLSGESLTLVEKAIAKGAKPVADACKQNLMNLKTGSNEKAMSQWRKKQKNKDADTKATLTEEQREGLIESMGLAPMRDDRGYVNTKLGFDGYNSIKTRRWPKGQPNVLIARVLESGSSAMEKQPFIRPAVTAKKNEAEKAMKNYLDQEIAKLMR